MQLLAEMNSYCPLWLATDLALYGGGAHVTKQLDVHLDCDVHPITGFRRAINAILFLDHSKQSPFELWSWDARYCIVQAYPRPGRLVVFEVGDESYHGVSQRSDIWRRSLAVYWWDPAGLANPKRQRAQFVTGPDREPDPEKKLWQDSRQR
jgi:hypothetical protein